MKRPIHLAAAGVLALSTVLAVPSCLFDTRDPQSPASETNACTLESPQKPFVCMTGAIADRKDANYDRSISDHFIFSPTIADSLDQAFLSKPDLYTNWDKDAETTALENLFAQATSTSVDFGSLQAIINKSTFVRFKSTYTLTVTEPSADSTVTTTFKGVANIDVRNEGGNWRVTFWDEVETVADFRTWGYKRGLLGLQFRP